MSEKLSPRTKRGIAIGTLSLSLAGSAALGFELAPSNGSQALPAKEAKAISADLYKPKDFTKGVPVPGILNGSVTLQDSRLGSTEITYKNPVILERNNSSLGRKSLDGTWIGIPEHNAQGHVVIHPIQIHEGKNDSQTETVNLNDSNNPVLYGAAVYTSEVTHSGDALIAFDITGTGNFPSVPVEAIVQK